MPGGRGELTRDEGGAAFAAVLDDFEQVAPVGVGQRREQPIVNGQEIQLGESGEEPGIGAIAATDHEVVQQPRRAHVRGRAALPTRVLDEGRRQPRLADARGPGDEKIVVLADPGAGAETQHHLAREPAGRREVDVLETGGIAELGMAEPLREPSVLPRRPFVIDEQAKAVLETEFGMLA
jgi:hypothetical protein